MSVLTLHTIERAPADYEALPARPASFTRFVRETSLLVARGLRTIPRVPTRLSDVTIQPIMFTLLFLYIFGSAIHIPGMTYQNFLLPGLIGQSLAFGVIGAGVATATDFASGVVDRFRSLPVTRLSVISSQVIGQVLEQILGISIVAGIGLALGWRPEHSLTTILALIGLVLAGALRLHLVRRLARHGAEDLGRSAGHRLCHHAAPVVSRGHVCAHRRTQAVDSRDRRVGSAVLHSWRPCVTSPRAPTPRARGNSPTRSSRWSGGACSSSPCACPWPCSAFAPRLPRRSYIKEMRSTRSMISSVSNGMTSSAPMFSRTWSADEAPVMTVETWGFLAHQASEN